MIELAELLILEKLPSGLLVGTASIGECRRVDGGYEWHLQDVKRLASPRKPMKHPQPVFFYPF